jgi:hypothetical protein
VTGLDLQGGAVKGVPHVGRRRAAVDAVVSNMDALRTYRELVGRRGGAQVRPQGLRARLLGRGASTRACPSATSTWRTTTSSSPGPGGGVRLHLQARRAGARPDLLPRAPSSTDPSVAPEGGEALYVLVHTPYLRPHHDWSKMLPGLPAGDPRQAEADGGPARHRGADRGRAAPDAAGHPRALQGAQRRHLRARQPRQVHRRLQAGQPQPARQGALPRRRGRAPRAGDADGDDVGLDRGDALDKDAALAGGPALSRPSLTTAEPAQVELRKAS